MQAASERVVREYVQRGHIRQADNTVPITKSKLKVAAYARVSTVTDTYLQHGNAHYSI